MVYKAKQPEPISHKDGQQVLVPLVENPPPWFQSVVRADRVKLIFFVLLCVLQEHAFESSQKYKEGKFIIELAHMIKDNGWE